MKTVGQYKGRDIKITDLYVCETYGNYLLLNKSGLGQENQKILEHGIPKTIERIFGKSRPIFIVDSEKFDLKVWLPRVMVCAWLCGMPIDESWQGSNLILVWFQSSAEDVFGQAAAHLKKIVWEEKAKDFDY